MIFVWQKCGIFCLEGMNLIEFGRMAKKYGYLILSSNIRKKDKKMVHGIWQPSAANRFAPEPLLRGCMLTHAKNASHFFHWLVSVMGFDSLWLPIASLLNPFHGGACFTCKKRFAFFFKSFGVPFFGKKNGTPKGIWTPNLLVRSQTLYPIELWVHLHLLKSFPDFQWNLIYHCFQFFQAVFQEK